MQALRSRDLLSNEERDELLFVPLGAPAHRAFFGDEYTALPTMLCAPLFVAQARPVESTIQRRKSPRRKSDLS